MASTWSSLKIQLMGAGDEGGTWGTVTNANLGTVIEEAITGSSNVTFASADVTLTLTDTTASQTARNLRLNLTGTTGGARNLVVPAIEKVYIVNNGCADAVTVKNSTGSGIAVPAGKTMYVFNNGTDVVDAITHLSSLTLASPLAIADGGTGSTTANFSGANITSLNASNILSGTIANARTTASSSNGASTIVTRDASGNFSANTITATLSGNATNVSGIVAVANGGTGASDAATARANLGAGTGNGTVTSVATSGSVNGLTLTGGTITTTGTITLGGSVNASTISTGILAIANGGTGSSTAAFSGANITSLNASNISSGTLSTARMASGTIVKVSSIVFSTRTVTSAGATYNLSIGSFTKIYDSSTSDIVITGTIPFWTSTNAGIYLNIKLGSTAKYTGIAKSQTSESNIASVTQYWTGVGAGSVSVSTGWATFGGSSDQPINVYCPNSADDGRNQQSGIELIIYEVLK